MASELANGPNANGPNVNERSTSQSRVNSHPSQLSVDAKKMSRDLIDTYFRTVLYPYTKHHIDSYDTFLQQDLKGIIKANNPILILKDLIDETTNTYKYKVELYIGGQDGEEIEIGTPTLYHQKYEEIRVLYPNEARLRNLTYASTVYATILVKITYTEIKGAKPEDLSPDPTTFIDWPLFTMPIMLHSSYCILHNKPKDFLKQAGECPYDNGGYFIVDGAEKVLITRQEKAFNTLYISPQNDPKTSIFASIQCLSAESRQIKRVAFEMTRYNFNKQKKVITHETIKVSLPFVRKPIPLFILFRAIGFQSDEEICRLIFPDFTSPEASLLMDKLQPSIIEAYPFLTTYTATQYIKTLTKGFSAEHVIDIIRNQLFIHMPNDPMSQAIFLGDCVRKILRVSEGYDAKTDRDEMRNMRCLTSGFLIQELFNNSYKVWAKAIRLAIDKEYNYNKQTLYTDRNFANIFTKANEPKIFLPGLLRDMVMKGFKGKWGTGLGEEKSGVLQSLSRLSYTDFMSHCRRVILDFDTGSAITGPRKLHTTQYGYFCTSETPTGGSIGIAKNLSIMTAISTSTKSAEFIAWLHKKGGVYTPEEVTIEERIAFVPVYVNGGIMGYSEKPYELTAVLKMFKRTGCLPYSVSIVFSIRDRAVYIYMDAGRPLRPLIWLPSVSEDAFKIQYDKIVSFNSWRFLVLGRLKLAANSALDVTMESTVFIDPYPDNNDITLKQYFQALEKHAGAIEYIDPYEQNETYIANFPYEIKPETTHIEVHPSTIMSMMTSMIPFAQHNQSPRNQLSCSQSKQGVSIYATNWQNRFDNSAHILCYGEMPLVRTMYNNYLGEGNMVYGMNCILAIGCWSGYNQEDGIVMNYDAVHRGMFRTINYRSYEIFEDDDKLSNTRIRIANPIHVAEWKDLRPGLDYSKLDHTGIIREGEIVDETTVLVGAYVQSAQSNMLKDASLCPQVWTRGRVEKVAIMMNNAGLHLVKIRIVQDRIPELGDKFSNRHGQKGTIGALLRGYDMPRTQSGIVPDMIMNPHAIPSRMTIAQNLEQLLGKSGLQAGAFGDGTSFMNSESPQEEIGAILEGNGFEKYGNEVMYNGATGEQITMAIFIGPVYGMRLKHMVEDKWQARGQGRKEVRTHQPTGGRGAQGGLKIGEMDRDAIIGHATASFFKEAFMERSDGVKMPICVSCGTVPIFNPRLKLAVCAMCDGPLQYIGDSATNLELLPPLGRPKSKIVQVEMPYATKLLAQEQETFLNLSMRFITTNGVERLRPLERIEEDDDATAKELKPLIIPLPDFAPFVNNAPDSLSADEILSLRTSLSNEENEQETNFNEDENEESEYASSIGSETSPVINITLSAPSEQPNGLPPQQNMVMPQQQNMVMPQQPNGLPQQQNMTMPQQQNMVMPQQQPQINVNGVPILQPIPQQPIPQQPIPQQPILQQQGGIPIQPNAPQQIGGSQVFPSMTGAPIIAIDTSMQAMQQDGIDMIGGGRTIRRRQGGYNQGFSQVPMQAPSQGFGQAAVGGFTITKLE